MNPRFTLGIGKNYTGGGGGGTPAYVEIQTSTGSASNVPQVVNLTIASGATVWVGTKWEDATATVTVADLSGNTYTSTSGPTNQGGQIWGQTFRCVNATSGALTITATFTGVGVGFVRAAAIELSGITAYDQSATPGTGTQGDAGSPAITGNISTPNAIEVLICMVCNYNGDSATPQAGWTEVYDPNAMAIQYLTTSSTNTYHGEAVLSGTTPWVAFLDAFK